MLTQEQKNLFVTRQRHMLEKYELGVCTHCPKGKSYSPKGSLVEGLGYFGWDVCEFCSEINGIDKPTKYFAANYDRFESNNYCPCHNYPPEDAVKRAWAAVEKWEKKNK